MEKLDDIMLDWAFEVDNGSPEPNNMEHLEILSFILEDSYKWPKDAIKEFITNIVLVFEQRKELIKEESRAAKLAKKKGLKSAGFGWWKDDTGTVVAQSVNGGNSLKKVKGKTTGKKEKPVDKKSVKKKSMAKEPVAKKRPTAAPPQQKGGIYEPTEQDIKAVNFSLNNMLKKNNSPLLKSFAKDVQTLLQTKNPKLANQMMSKYDLSINKNAKVGENSKLYIGANGKSSVERKVFSGGGNKASTIIAQVLKDTGALKAGSNFTKKSMTPNQIFSEKSTLKIKKSAKGAVIGKHTIPYAKNYNYKNVQNLYLQQGISREEAAKKTAELKKRVDRHNFILDNIESIVGGSELDVLQVCGKCDVSTPQGIEFTKKVTKQKIVEKMEALGGSSSKGASQIIKSFNELDKIKDKDQYSEKLNEILHIFSKAEDTKATSADVTEMIDYLRVLNNGAPAYLPEASNFALGDILRLPSKQPTIKEIMASDDISSIFVSLEDRSVKKDAGGASESSGKIKLTQFKNPNTKKDLLKITDSFKSLIHEGDTKTADNLIAGLQKRYGKMLSQDPKYVQKMKNKNEWLKRNSKSIHDVKVWDRYYQLGYMLAGIHNSEVEFQGYQNSRYNVRAKRVDHDLSDGVNRIAHLEFDPSQINSSSGKPNNPYPTRFHHVDV